MTTPRIEIAFAPAGWREALDRYLVQHAHGMNGYMLSRGRIESLIRLHALSDVDLARMGLTRDALPAFVFEDILQS